MFLLCKRNGAKGKNNVMSKVLENKILPKSKRDLQNLLVDAELNILGKK